MLKLTFKVHSQKLYIYIYINMDFIYYNYIIRRFISKTEINSVLGNYTIPTLIIKLMEHENNSFFIFSDIKHHLNSSRFHPIQFYAQKCNFGNQKVPIKLQVQRDAKMQIKNGLS